MSINKYKIEKFFSDLRKKREALENAIRWPFIIVFVVFTVCYFFSLFPLLVFFVLPFIVFSFLFALCFFWSSLLFPKLLDYRFVWLFPIFTLVIYLSVGLPVTVHVDTVIENGWIHFGDRVISKWPELSFLYQRFENYLNPRRRWPWQGIYYREEHLSGILFLALFVGAPIAFSFFWAKKTRELSQKKIEDPIRERLEWEKRDVKKLEAENTRLKRSLDEAEVEMKRLRDRDEHVTRKEEEKARTHKGILDDDKF